MTIDPRGCGCPDCVAAPDLPAVTDANWAVAGKLQELDTERCQFEDRIKAIGEELAEINRAHSDRCMVLIEERKKAATRVREILDEAESMRNQKQII